MDNGVSYGSAWFASRVSRVSVISRDTSDLFETGARIFAHPHSFSEGRGSLPPILPGPLYGCPAMVDRCGGPRGTMV
eukprot:754093-Hanusia_phi.AAC.1